LPTRRREQADLAALGVGRQEVDDLDTGDEHFGFRRLVGIGRRFPHGSAQAFGFHRACFVDRLADHVHDAAERARRPERGSGAGGRCFWPRTRPSVVSSRWCAPSIREMLATSSTRRLPPFLVSIASESRADVLRMHVDDGG